MSWWRKEPGHQQPWYWPSQTEITWSLHVKGSFDKESKTLHLSMPYTLKSETQSTHSIIKSSQVLTHWDLVTRICIEEFSHHWLRKWAGMCSLPTKSLLKPMWTKISTLWLWVPRFSHHCACRCLGTWQCACDTRGPFQYKDHLSQVWEFPC